MSSLMSLMPFSRNVVKSSLERSRAEVFSSCRVAFSKAERLFTSSLTVLRSCWRALFSSAIAARCETDSANALPSFSTCATALCTGDADCSFWRKYWHHRSAWAWCFPAVAAAPGCVRGSTFCKRCHSSANFGCESFARANFCNVWLRSTLLYCSSTMLATEARDALLSAAGSSRNTRGARSSGLSLAAPGASLAASPISRATGSRPAVAEESCVKATATSNSLAAALMSSLA
mmetsp:Transcript_45050/g.134620  ORF Transcript_45050/g.134620 Transcript_45050/m.134620 type:complete len:233 (-) Transcript_45050:79-777(-)